jgi:lysylphosphatidylglycerol synthetase-like protein (DUF2156 family)
LAYRRIAFASFIGYAFSNSVGHSLVTGGSLRYRLYSGWGLSALEVASVVAFCDLTLWLGFFALAGAAFLVEPLAVPAGLHLPLATARPIGVVFLLAVAACFAWLARARRPLHFRGWELPVPPPALGAAGLALAAVDWAVAAGVLYALLPPGARIGYAGFVTVFLLAQTLGLVSQVPAGLGVFEGVMVLLLGPAIPAPQLLGSLLAFRALYYLLPLLVAAVLLGLSELWRPRTQVRRLASSLGQWMPALVPHLVAASTFVGGAVLLVSGATPAESQRLRFLQDFVPLPVIETSHFLGSLAGVGLLFLARGLQRRLDGAWVLAVGLAAGWRSCRRRACRRSCRSCAPSPTPGWRRRRLWAGAAREELSMDLMRHLPDAPAGIMDYLFVRLMLWGKSEGYAWFNLGMAPLAGLENRALAPLWTRLGGWVFRHGEQFYNFQGLRQFKEKFDPVWEPKYLASPRGAALPRVLANLSSLIAGGLKGVITK